MKVVAINSMAVGSTGTIMLGIKEYADKSGIEYTAYCGSWKAVDSKLDCKKFGWKIENYISEIVYRLVGIQHVGSILGTIVLINELKLQKPDIVHLHNLHLWVINVPMLFSYLKRKKIKVIWTLHDCWAFTGQCPHYSMIKCQKWKNGCYKCPQIHEYPMSYVDTTKIMWKLKKKWFTNVHKMIIVTPSKWLEAEVRKSFLNEYEIQTIYNGIDLNVFKPTFGNIYSYYKKINKKIVLGVAFDWGVKKGLDIFNELADRLSEDYMILLVGVSEKLSQTLNPKIKSIERTKNKKELAEYYTVADVFVNPTRQEVLGLVNIEANACGTPVITFDSGGSPECISEKSGCVVPVDDVNRLEKEVREVCSNEKIFNGNDCIIQAKKFNKNERFKEYIKLYERINYD